MNRARDARRGRVLFSAAATALGLAIGACSPGPTATPGPIETASIVAPASGGPVPPSGTAAPSATASLPESPVTGVLVDIDATGLSEVTGFTLRLDDGRSFELLVGILENAAEFPPGHLAEHLATSTPVRAFFRLEGSDLVVYRLEDAG